MNFLESVIAKVSHGIRVSVPRYIYRRYQDANTPYVWWILECVLPTTLLPLVLVFRGSSIERSYASAALGIWIWFTLLEAFAIARSAPAGVLRDFEARDQLQEAQSGFLASAVMRFIPVMAFALPLLKSVDVGQMLRTCGLTLIGLFSTWLLVRVYRDLYVLFPLFRHVTTVYWRWGFFVSGAVVPLQVFGQAELLLLLAFPAALIMSITSDSSSAVALLITWLTLGLFSAWFTNRAHQWLLGRSDV